MKYFYPRPPRGGRPAAGGVTPNKAKISIHALREEGDPKPYFEIKVYTDISIHALREDSVASVWAAIRDIFGSVHVHGASSALSGTAINFYVVYKIRFSHIYLLH